MTQAPNQKAKDTLELRRQQRQRTPEAIAETYRQKQERDAELIGRCKIRARMVQGDFEAMNEMTQLEHDVINKGNDAFEASQEARRERERRESAEQENHPYLARLLDLTEEARQHAQTEAEREKKAAEQAETEKQQTKQKIEEIYANECKAKGLGLTMAQLARELDKDPDTIKHHVQALPKLGVVKSDKHFDKQEADEIRQRVRQVERKIKKP